MLHYTYPVLSRKKYILCVMCLIIQQCSGAGAGAVVGGLVAGPLGAVLGAAIGTKAGAKNAKPAESEFDQLVKEIDSEIAVIQANYEVSTCASWLFMSFA